MSADAEADNVAGDTFTWVSPAPAATLEFGRRLGAMLEPGDVVALIGPLGAGKTHFVKGLALGLGLADARDVTSPTFVLVNEYAGRLPIYHFDAYRLDGPGALEDLGVAEYLGGDGVSVIEWADRVPDVLPPERLEVHLAHAGPQARRLRVRAVGQRRRRIVARLAADSRLAP